MTIKLDVQDDVALISMDDGKANAVGYAFLDAMNAALDEAEAKAKAIVVAGRPGVFSAGFDLKVMRGATPGEVAALVTGGGRLALRLFACPKPTVAACTGHALAMGAILLLGFDTRIGAEGEFKIGLNETAIGMGLPAFGFDLPKARLAPAHFTPAIIQAHLYGPVGAVQAGYLDATAPADKAVTEAMEVAGRLASLPGQAYAQNKAGVRKGTIEALRATLG
jgi:enoyl-CoA hydratase